MKIWELSRYAISGCCLLLGAGCGLACSANADTVSRNDPATDPDTRPADDGAPGPTLSEAWSLETLPDAAVPVGIAQDSGAQAVYVLATGSGLYKMGLHGPELVFDTTQLTDQGIELESDFTDVTALSEARFALTAKNEGYLLDLVDGSLTLFFCYLPSIPAEPEPPVSVSELYQSEGVDVYQMTQAVAHDPSAGLLYAQPLTIDSETGEVYGSEIGAFFDDTGEPTNWLTVPDSSFQATGMVSVDGESFTLARGSKLYRMTTDGFWEIADLSSYGIDDIAGLAPRGDGFWVLDAGTRKIFKLDLP